MVALPPPLFLGFVAKMIHPVSPGGWGGAQEICSVSPCIAGYPAGWDDDPFDAPAFNRAYCQDSAASARQRIEESARATSRLYALRMIPAVFTRESAEPFLLSDDDPVAGFDELPDLPLEPDLSGWERLGYDVTVVGLPDAPLWGWSCSPLSCNAMCMEHGVNRYCLLDDLAAAVRAAQAFAHDEPEPGPYVVVEVWRERSFASGE
jgi:hypothetical protein